MASLATCPTHPSQGTPKVNATNETAASSRFYDTFCEVFQLLFFHDFTDEGYFRARARVRGNSTNNNEKI